ncbi:MAG: substrate-binding domain-containing protein [Actinomycetota bacterium]
MNRRWIRSVGVLAALTLVLAACGGDEVTDGDGEQAEGRGPDAAAALQELTTEVLSTGPHGETATDPAEVSLTEEELAEIRGMNATAAIVMHYSGDDWSRAQIDGLRAQFAEMGIEVVATTDADFVAETQVSDIETVTARNPDIIVSIPVDAAAAEAAYQAAADEGVVIVFADNAPPNMVAGQDYVATVSADNSGNGVAAAHLMAEALNKRGEVGVVYHEADFFVTQQRYDAFVATITENYPDIEIVSEQGIPGPDFAVQAQEKADAMLTQFPDLDGIWAVWDVPAEGVLAAAGTAGWDGVVTTIDLGLNVAIDIASGGVTYGLGAQRPYDQGVNEAILAGYGLLDKEAPPYVALNALPVTSDNVLDAWTEVYHVDPPPELAEA